MGDPDSYSW